MTGKQWLSLVFLSILWGGSFVAVEVALEAFAPPLVVFFRVFLAGVALYIYVRVKRLAFPRGRGVWRDYAVMALLSTAFPFMMIVLGQTQVSGSVASILNAMTPIFTVIVAHFFTLDERLSVPKAIGTLIAFLGVVVLMAPAMDDGLSLTNLGQLSVLAGALSYAFAAVWAKRLNAYPPAVNSAATLLTASVLLIPVLASIPSSTLLESGDLTLRPLIAVLSLALLSTAVAFIIYYRILAEAGATNIVLVTFMIPVSAMVLGALILGESISATSYLAMLLIFAGLAFIDGRVLRKIKAASAASRR